MVTFHGLSEEEIDERLAAILASHYMAGEEVDEETIAVIREILEGKRSTEEVLEEVRAKYPVRDSIHAS